MTKSFLKDMVKYLPAQVVPALTGFIAIPIITRLFLPQDYGNYNIVMAMVVLMCTLLGWLSISIIRFYPAFKRDKKLDVFYENIIYLIFISTLAISCFFLIILFFIKAYLSSELYLLLWVGFGVVVFTGLFNVLQHFLRIKRQVNWYSGFAVWKTIGSLGIGLLLIFLLQIGIESILWGTIICIVMIIPLLWRKAVKGTFSLHFKIDALLTKEMAKYSFPIVVGNLAAWVLSLSDRYLLMVFRGPQEVGIYSASYNIADHSLMLIVTLVTLASSPILINFWEKEGESKSKEFLIKVTRYYVMLCAPTMIALWVLSKPIMKIMTGEQYHEGHIIFPFVLLGVFFLGLQKRFNDGLLLYKKTNFIAFAILSSGFLNVFLNLLFIPIYGYFGAAITTLISYAFLLFLMIVFSRKFIVWEFPFKSFMKVAFASANMGIVVYFVGYSLTSSIYINLISAICIGVVVYLLMLLLLNEFSQEEIQMFYTLKQKLLK